VWVKHFQGIVTDLKQKSSSPEGEELLYDGKRVSVYSEAEISH